MLPLDHARAPGAARQWETTAAAIGSDEVGPVVTALAIVLARYAGAEAVRLRVELRGVAPRDLAITTAPSMPLAEVAASVDAALAGTTDDDRGGHLPLAAWVRWADDVGEDDDATELRVAIGPTTARWRHDGATVAASTVTRAAGHVAQLLRALATAPTTSVGVVGLASDDERAALARLGVGPDAALPPPPVHAQVAAHAAARPDAIAVRHRDRSLTYGALDARANQLAHALAARGAGVGARVIVCLEPGLEIAIAVLGVLKAGAIYIPLDPGYPPARIAAILDDVAPAIVVTTAPLARRLRLEATDPAADLRRRRGRARAGIHLGARARARRQRAGDGLLHVGHHRPAQGRAGLPRQPGHLPAQRTDPLRHRRRRGDAGDRALRVLHQHVRADVAAVRRRHPGRARSRGRARSAAPRRRPHRGHVLPRRPEPAARAGAGDGALGPARYAGVRHASSGGDMIAPELLRGLAEVCPAAEVFVIYGCSEISCMGCTYPVPREPPATRTFVGRPMPTVRVAVLDAAGQPVPAGVVGEVWFAGGGVVLGYLDRPSSPRSASPSETASAGTAPATSAAGAATAGSSCSGATTSR
ncbi:MAG: AMP-binding protein [Kofleriaceae bacterium]